MHYENHHFPEFLAGPPHPPYGPEVGPWYDRCAPGCDDQLAMFSRVGRGLKGDGFKVVINSDSDMETYLEGLSYDEASGTWASEWISENINGGRLDYQYNLRPYTIPQTFTITFRYRRPNRDPYQWTWTTPAIPYIWDADDDGFGDVDGIVGVGAATLFLKKTQDAWVTTNLPTSYTIAEALGRQEKLLYPEGWTRDQLNAPGVGDPYTINLTYGIGGDFDAPNIDDLSKVLGITVQNIRNIIADYGDSYPTATIPDIDYKHYVDRRDAEDLAHIHGDMGFGDHLINDDNDHSNLTIKKYIDNMIDNVLLSSVDPSLLKVTKTTKNHNLDGSNFAYGIEYSLDPVNPIAGNGIKLVNSNGQLKISNNIIAGPGINIARRSDGGLIISNSQVGGVWTKLVAGRDFEYSVHNGWWFGDAQTGAIDTNPSASQMKPPMIEVMVSRDLDDNISSAEIRIGADEDNDAFLVNKTDMLSRSNFLFAHSADVNSSPLSAIVSFTFKGDYADLNDLSVLGVSSMGTNIWNIYGNNSAITSSSGWSLCGASWLVNCGCQKGASGYRTFVIFAVNISDGYNVQYDTPSYGYSHLAIRPYANFDWKITLG